MVGSESLCHLRLIYDSRKTYIYKIWAVKWSSGCIFDSVWSWPCHSCQCATLWLMVLPTVGEGNSGGRERVRESTKSTDTESGMKCFLPLLTEKLSVIFRGHFTQLYAHSWTLIHSLIHSYLFLFLILKTLVWDFFNYQRSVEYCCVQVSCINHIIHAVSADHPVLWIDTVLLFHSFHFQIHG